MVDRVLDLRGLKCPVVEFETAKVLFPMEDGSVIEVISDDPVAEREVPSWCSQTGNELLSIEKDEVSIKFQIMKP